jgi:hypothetical protein
MALIVLLFTFIFCVPIHAYFGHSGGEFNMVDVWKFDEGSGTEVRSHQEGSPNHPFTMAGNPTWVTGPFGGWAIHFDGTGDEIATVATSDFDLNNGGKNYTIAGWFRLTAIGVNEVQISCNSSGLSNGIFIQTDVNGAFIVWNLGAGGVVSANGRVKKSTWYRFVVSWDGTTLRAYLNNEKVIDSVLGAGAATGSKPFNIGGNTVDPSYDKLIGDVGVDWIVLNRAWTGEEVGRDYYRFIINESNSSTDN